MQADLCLFLFVYGKNRFSHDVAHIIPTPHHNAYFEQFDWLEKKFYTSINSISMNLGTRILPAPNMCNNVDKKKVLMTKLELEGTNYIFCGFYRCVISGESLTNLIYSSSGFIQFVSNLPELTHQ